MIISSTEDRASRTRDWVQRRRLLQPPLHLVACSNTENERKSISAYLKIRTFNKWQKVRIAFSWQMLYLC